MHYRTDTNFYGYSTGKNFQHNYFVFSKTQFQGIIGRRRSETRTYRAIIVINLIKGVVPANTPVQLYGKTPWGLFNIIFYTLREAAASARDIFSMCPTYSSKALSKFCREYSFFSASISYSHDHLYFSTALSSRILPRASFPVRLF